MTLDDIKVKVAPVGIKRVYTCHFHGWWPVGAVAVVVAENPDEALRLMDEKIDAIGLRHKQPQRLTLADIVEVDQFNAGVTVLLDGDY